MTFEILLVSCRVGPSGHPFRFNYASRNCIKTMDELGRLLTNVCRIVPGGVVVFFASYQYQEKVVSRWKGSGDLYRMEKNKRVFFEKQKSETNVLEEYTNCIQRVNNFTLYKGAHEMLLNINVELGNGWCCFV